MPSSDACHEISAQLHHILSILNGQLFNDNNNGNDVDIDHHHQQHHDDDDDHHHHSIYQISKMITHNQSTKTLPTINGRRLQFFNVSNEFEELLKVCLKYCSPETITQLVNTPQWKETYQSVCDAVESRFIPMYLESPEYIRYSFGFSHFSTSVSSLNKIGV
ncbi:unnamed protein product [Schistosoma margrebowiei]|nr:unnamed protein product [Schistosoma margrebowiei]